MNSPAGSRQSLAEIDFDAFDIIEHIWWEDTPETSCGIANDNGNGIGRLMDRCCALKLAKLYLSPQ